MNLDTIKTLFAGLVDDADSAGFFKKHEAVKHLTKSQLIDLIEQAWAAKYPGAFSGHSFSRNNKGLYRSSKLDVIRHLAKVVSLLA